MMAPDLKDPGTCTCRAAGKMTYARTKGVLSFRALCTRPAHAITTPPCATQEEAIARFRYGRV